MGCDATLRRRILRICLRAADLYGESQDMFKVFTERIAGRGELWSEWGVSPTAPPLYFPMGIYKPPPPSDEDDDDDDDNRLSASPSPPKRLG